MPDFSKLTRTDFAAIFSIAAMSLTIVFSTVTPVHAEQIVSAITPIDGLSA